MFSFGQSGFTIVAPVLDQHLQALESYLASIQFGRTPNNALFCSGMPKLHFCSLFLFKNGQTTILVFEGNVDGPVREFFEELCKQPICLDLDKIYGCCEGYSPSQRSQYLAQHDVGYNTFYVGCPGRTLVQIERESFLRDELEAFVDRQRKAGVEVDRKLILQYVSQRNDLKEFLTPYVRPFAVRHGGVIFKLFLALLVVILVALIVGAFVLDRRLGCFVFAAIVALVVGSLLWLRHLENTDKPFPNQIYAPSVAEVVALEDFGISNHMASITTIKPGFFRKTLLRGVLWAIDLVALLVSNQGTLGGIPSIYFARWVIVGKDKLVFMSNFGGSWESYLNDFIDQAHTGLTAVWSNSVGFPKTQWLTQDGASQELEFKVYARNSQVPSLVWYRAYSDLSTTNIENNTRIREGLLGSMTPQEEKRWLARL